jgi:type III pantothenate kinase
VNWAIEEHDQFINTGVFNYEKSNFLQELQDNFLSLQKPSAVLVANVAGIDVFNDLQVWVKQQWQLQCWQASVGASFNGLKNSYSDVKQMGVDRWLAMVAAWEKHPSALCVVDCGTAVTIDSIEVHGNHLGGYIVPGIQLMQQALIAKTAGINSTTDKRAVLEYAKDTQTAINNGATFAIVAMIDRVMSNLANESNCRPKCIITGGMAEIIQPLLQDSFEHEPYLVLCGLLIMYKASL